MSGYGGGLNRSMQHSLAGLEVGFSSPYIAPERNPKRTQPCLGLIASSGSDRLSSGRTAPSSDQRVLHRPSEPAAFIRSQAAAITQRSCWHQIEPTNYMK